MPDAFAAALQAARVGVIQKYLSLRHLKCHLSVINVPQQRPGNAFSALTVAGIIILPLFTLILPGNKEFGDPFGKTSSTITWVLMLALLPLR